MRLAPALPAQAQALTLPETLALALEQAPALQMQQAALQARQSDRSAAGRLPDPRLGLGVENLPVAGPDRWSATRDSTTMQRLTLMQEVPNTAKREASRAVADAREVFATPRRFPEADEVVVDWPHRWLSGQPVDSRTVICVLTHDPKFDVPALEVALRTDAGYVGAMGSRRTHEDRLRRLKEAGMTDEELARLHSPIGLDLGARTPEETAISIAAEVIQSRWGGTGERLAQTSGPIHPGAPR